MRFCFRGTCQFLPQLLAKERRPTPLSSPCAGLAGVRATLSGQPLCRSGRSPRARGGDRGPPPSALNRARFYLSQKLDSYATFASRHSPIQTFRLVNRMDAQAGASMRQAILQLMGSHQARLEWLDDGGNSGGWPIPTTGPGGPDGGQDEVS